MKQLILFVAILFANMSLIAQVNLGEGKELLKRIEAEAENIQSIESDFVQTKHLDIFNETVVSKGHFYYMTGNKITLDYNSPQPYLIVINDSKLKIESAGKKNVMSLKSNKLMKEMQEMLAGCMSGKISQITGYSMSFFEETNGYLIVVKPTQKSILDYITQFDISLDKDDLSVTRLIITEASGDYTDYRFTNRKFNTLTDEKKFAIP